VIAAAVGVVLAGCGTSSPGEGQPAAATDPEVIEVGADLYRASCAACHGADLRGTSNGPSHLSIVYEPNHHGDAAFQLAVQRGAPAHHWEFGNMPPIEGLSDNDVQAIIAFVRETQRAEGFEPYPP
jgi:mono/diheme cytochrome c family protein